MNWLTRLPPEIRASLLAEAKERSFAAKALVYALFEDPGGIFLVTSGAARLYLGRADGRQLVLQICRVGDLFGQTASTDGELAPIFAEARSALRTLFFPRAIIDRLREAHPLVERELARQATRTIRAQWSLIESFALLSLRERLLARLRYLADEEVERTGSDAWAVIEITQDELASMLGASRPALNKELRTLAASGAIRASFGRIAVGPDLPRGS